MKGLLTDDRGQTTARRGVLLIVSIVVAVIVGSVMAPVAIDQLEGDTTETLTQDVNTVYDVNGELTSEVTAVTDGTSATVELNDTRTAGTTSNTVSVGSTTSYDLQGGTVNVTVNSATSGTPDTAEVTYEYDKTFAYSDGAASLWGILGLTIVLGLFLLVLRRATSAADF